MHASRTAASAASLAALRAAGLRGGVRPQATRGVASPSVQAGSAAALSRQLDAAVAANVAVHRRTFDFGFYRACADREELTRFMLAHYFLHGALERALAAQPAASPAARVWAACGGVLRGAPRKLERDLRALGVDGTSQPPSAASAAYVAGVEDAASDGALLLGHFYGCYGRTFGFPGDDADALAGLERRGRAVRLAAGLPEGRPEFFQQPAVAQEDPTRWVDSLRAAVDAEGVAMSSEERARAEEGAQAAVELSAAVYAERPSLTTGAVRGYTAVMRGYLAERVLGAAAPLEAGNGLPAVLLPTARRELSPCGNLHA